MGMDEYNFDFECTPAQYTAGLSKLWLALGNRNPRNEDVFTLAARAIEEAQQRPSRREIAAMAMQGLLANPGFREDVVHGRIAKMAIDEANNLTYHLNADPAEGVDPLPMHSRELDEGMTDGN